MIISHLAIQKLNSVYNYSIPIFDNRLILVGENGTGKSTVLSILNSILTRQWDKLLEYSFSSISIVINHTEYNLSRKELREYNLLEKNPRMSRAENYVRRVIRKENLDIVDIYENDDLRVHLRHLVSLNTPIKLSDRGIENVLNNMLNEQTVFSENSVTSLDKLLKRELRVPIIYLPTYRRIERDISSIVPNMEKRAAREFGYGLRDMQQNLNQIELVEFGMSDVKDIIENALSELEDSFRTGMKKLMGDYLQDILLHQHNDFEITSLSSIEPQVLEKMLLRIDSDTLSNETKQIIKENILNLTNGEEFNLSESDRVIYYFISKLMEFHEEQSKAEKFIKLFMGVCNKYLVGKNISFNSLTFQIQIFHAEDSGEIISKNEIPFESLSSGEKQIVSIFSHLYLSNKREFMIVIDEPELSLSVDWQRSFLEDIANTGSCEGMFAVTHSPFIFDNNLDQYACSISEFMERS